MSLIIPVLNEAEALGLTLRELPWHLLAECIVVENGSTTDRAAEEVQRNGACFVLEPLRGYGRACNSGAPAATRASEELAFMDGHGSHIPSNLVRMPAPVLEGEADFIIGPRISGNREPLGTLLSQIFAGWSAAKLIRWRFGLEHADMGPIRVISRQAFERMDMSEMTYGWASEGLNG